MKLADAYTDLMGLVGLQSFAHAPVGMKARMCADVNATLQLVFGYAAELWLRQERSATFPASCRHAFKLVQGRKTFTSPSLPKKLYRHCTVNVGGQVNKIMGNGSLLLPASKTGMVEAFVYGDATALDGDIEQVGIPVVDTTTGRQLRNGSLNISFFAPRFGVAQTYTVQSDYSNGKMVSVMRLYPLSGGVRTVVFPATLRVPQVEMDDDEKPLHRQVDIPIPLNYWQSIFLPILKQQFSTWPHYASYGNVENLRQGRDLAVQALNRLRPQAVRDTKVIISDRW